MGVLVVDGNGQVSRADCSDGSQMVVDGVDVCKTPGKQGDAETAKAETAKAELAKRYPGVHFEGAGTGASISAKTRIAPGAHVSRSATIIDSTIGATAVIGASATVTNSTVAGRVTDFATVEGSQLATGAQVSGNAEVRGSNLAAGAKASGNATVEAMTLSTDSQVSGNSEVRGFTTQPGQKIAGGIHNGAWNPKAKTKAKASSGVNITVGQVTINGKVVSPGVQIRTR